MTYLAGEEQWLATIDAFSAAALGEKSWYDALDGMAAACGSRSGQLIGIGSQAAVAFNWMTDWSTEAQREFFAINGGHPAVNPRVRVGERAPLLKVLSDGDYVDAQERRTDPYFTEFCRRHDIPYICQTTLIRKDGGLIGLAVNRTQSQGEISQAQRRVFESIAPHVRSAVHMQMALEGQGALVVSDALEAMSLAAFVCDANGAVRAMTPSAEALVSEGNVLGLSGSKLRVAERTEAAALTDAVALAAGGLIRPSNPVSRSVVIGRNREQPIALKVFSLKRRQHSFGFEPTVLIVVGGSAGKAAERHICLQKVFGLTAAEADVAAKLATGSGTEAIAAQRGVSVGTVRLQIKSIFAKVGVNRRAELVALISHL